MPTPIRDTTPRLDVFSATRPRDLLEEAVRRLGHPVEAENPLQPRWVIQPGRLWERALRRGLADQGIAAGLLFGSLRLTLERAFRLVCPDRLLMDEQQLFWAVLALLHRGEAEFEAMGLREGTPPRLWMAANADDPSLARIRLARLLAGILDDHATYRPADVLAWLADGRTPDADAEWIAALARSLWTRADAPRPLALQTRTFVQRLQEGGSVPWTGCPSRVVAVLNGAQPLAYLEALGALGLGSSVCLLVQETCERGLSEAMTTWRDVRRQWKAAGCPPSLQDFVRDQKWMLPGTLQAFWGASGITLQQQLVDLESLLEPLGIAVEDGPGPAEVASGGPTCGGAAGLGIPALAILQEDIRHSHEPRPPESRRDLPVADRSLRLLNATSPLRELEGARDAIRDALQHDPALRPSDVLMILVDVKRHAPLLPAVFGSMALQASDPGPDGVERIPWHLADRSLRTDSDTMAALLDLLEALSVRITLPVLADLLAQPAIQARLAFSQTDSVEMVDCLSTAGFRWGLSRQDRVAQEQPGRDDGMWTLEFALRRLAAGFAHPDRVLDPVGDASGITPLPAFEGLAAAKLMRFAAWARDLEAAHRSFSGHRPLGSAVTGERTWLGWLHDWMPKLLELEGEREGRSVWLSRITREIADQGALLEADHAFSAAAFADLLTEAATALEQSLPLGQGIGGITVASPRMARALPARLIVVVGLSDGAWPKQDPSRPRGLLTKPSPGDRSRREDDRQSTLEWVLSASEALVWTWQGRHEQSGGEVPPSVVVGELLDVCKGTFRDAPGRFVRRLGMHGFGGAEFAGDSASYDRVAAAAASALAQARQAQADGATIPQGEALPLLEDPWGLPGLLEFARTGIQPGAWSKAQWIRLAQQLGRFWRLPCKEFLRLRDVHVADDFAALPERESLTLGALPSWDLRNTLLGMLLEDPAAQVDPVRRRLTRAGRLPPGVEGDRSFKELHAEVTRIAETAREEAGSDATICLLANMNWDAPVRLVRVAATRFSARHLLGARIEQTVHAVLCNAAVHCTLVGRQETRELPVLAPDEALRELRRLTALALLGTAFPLPFFPGASSAYAGKQDLRGAEEQYREGMGHSRDDPIPSESEHPACRLAFRDVDPFSMELPAPPAPPEAQDDWNALVAVAALPPDDRPLFARLAESVLGFVEQAPAKTAARKRATP